MSRKKKRIPGKELFRRGVIAGFGWSLGVTVGFVVISTVVLTIFNTLGGLPIIGSFIAGIVEETQNQIFLRNPLYRD